ncbi:hypothetical protein SO802_005040 [Lithocarpus litseifolius]|uniref:E3 ubiquitin-protein ligase synoviolin-like TPR repeats domain-containing protein n=1 Tax=Lithocarpus litseifolius TaxID=425828 RepID=A0AAW2DJG7_9ROSI
MYPPETRKLLVRLVNYVTYKGLILLAIVGSDIFHAGLWSVWLTILCSLKMFQALARDRLERLNASPSATPWTYFCVYSVLLIRLCLVIYKILGSSMFLLLFFEPFSIAFETLQAILVHGFQLLDIWLHSAGNSTNFQRFKFLDTSAAGSQLWEWKGILIRNVGISLDMATLLMALGHYVHIWWLHGMAFHLVDAVLFLNICALLGAMFKRIKGFIKLRKALGALHAALPDATTEELQAYEDECAISRPLFIGRPENEVTPRTGEVLTDKQLARQIGAGLDRQNNSEHTLPTGVFPNQTQNPMEGGPWRFVSVVVSLACLEIRTLLPLTGKAYKLALEST